MTTLHKGKTALAVGLFLGGFHLVWAILVALGWAQAIYDFILWAHMVHIQLVIGPFDVTAAIVLIIMTFVIGWVIGWVFAWIWNYLHRGKRM